MTAAIGGALSNIAPSDIEPRAILSLGRVILRLGSDAKQKKTCFFLIKNLFF